MKQESLHMTAGGSRLSALNAMPSFDDVNRQRTPHLFPGITTLLISQRRRHYYDIAFLSHYIFIREARTSMKRYRYLARYYAPVMLQKDVR